MTEDEWLKASDHFEMLRFLRDKATDRKIRLFAVACCRRLWDSFDDTKRQFLEAIESFAEGIIDRGQLDTVQKAVPDSEESAFQELSWGMDPRLRDIVLLSPFGRGKEAEQVMDDDNRYLRECGVEPEQIR